MEDTGYLQLPIDKLLPGVSNLGSDVTLMRFQNHGGLNGGSDGSPKVQKLPLPILPIRERPSMCSERPKPNVVAETYIKKPEKKRPTTFLERLKWLKKFPNTNMKKNKYTKISDAASFKNNLEKRKALQHPKMFGTTLANGNHDLMKSNMNEVKEYEFPKVTNLMPKSMSSPTMAKNTLLINKGKFEGSSSYEESSSAHHANAQPSVTFKCRKCSCTLFDSLEMLKEHQLHCSSQASSSESAFESDPSNAGHGSGTGSRTAKQVVLCSACGTYFENWNLFLHMRDVHGRHICLFCLGLFSQADKLSSHLMSKHNVQVNCFKSKEEIVEKFTETFYLICCKCELGFKQSDNYATHECTQVIRHCLVCNSKGGHKVDCPKNSKHKYAGHLDVDPNKKMKKNVTTNKQIYEPPLNVLPSMEVANTADRAPFAGFDVKPVKDISDLSLLEGIGVNELNSLTYVVPDVKPEKISATSMALLIEEVKNCLSTTQPLPPPPPPPPIPVDTDTAKLINNDHTNVSNDLNKTFESSSQSTSSDVNLLESHSSPTPHEISKISNISNTNSNNKNSSDIVNSDKSTANVHLQEKDTQSDTVNEKEVNRVPKLTVKVPKVTSEKESSDYSSESEDSDKLTVDLEPKVEGTTVNTVEKENLPENTEVKKCDVSQDSETPGEDIPIIELTLDQPLDRYPLKDLLEVLLNASIYSCIYCNHARKIAVNGKQLGLHFISQHKFTATVNSITAEELLPETIVSKIKSCLQDVENMHINLDEFGGKTDAPSYDHNYECFQCYYVTKMHKDLYFHNRKMHQKSILLCIMCKSSFYTYSELICHLCPGVYVLNSEILFRCCICRFEPIPSAFRLMVHLRKRHHACDVCLEICCNQSKLSTHVWKHKLHHLCYRCGIAYRNKPDITKHLFWKHGTESVLCKKCLQRKWPHVYHFCVPPTLFTCEECNLNFTKAVYLKVHKRIHTEEYPYECVEPNCVQKFISKKLLLKHKTNHSDSMNSERPLTNLDKSSSNNNGEIIDLCDKSEIASTNDTKSKKSKKSKSFKDNLLMDVNLPALNLSESGSSDDSDSETNKRLETPESSSVNPGEDNLAKTDAADDSKPEPPVQGIWDNFKLYQESLEKQIEKPHIPVHVCESDHDYCLIPTDESPDVEIVGETKSKTENRASVSRDNSPKKKTKSSKKKGKSDTISSSSDSSSDSDSCCSGTNCSCSSSSGSSSSSSSSDSSSTNSPKRRNNARKDSDASHTSAIDIMAIGESPLRVNKSKELSFAESDLDSDESATDEEFYDKHPEKIANKLLAEKRNQLIQSANASPINNGTYFDASRPPTPDDTDKLLRKKVKVKKRKKEKKMEMILETASKLISDGTNIPILEQPSVSNKITISLQSNTVQLQESTFMSDSMKSNSGALSDADSKRASKRRRVPNKFYGYSSDEEHLLKPHQPPRLEWRKEDLPSPIVIQHEIPRIPEIPHVPELTMPIPEPIIPIILPPKESSSEDSDSSKEGALQIKDPYSPSEREPESAKITEILPPVDTDIPFPRPTGAREAREGESVYCYCRCPYDEVSEMIACDADGCSIEWFHFECVGIMVPPKGKWFCPDCRVRQDNLHK